MTPANAEEAREPAERGLVVGEVVHAVRSTSAPTPVTMSARSSASASIRKLSAMSSVGIHGTTSVTRYTPRTPGSQVEQRHEDSSGKRAMTAKTRQPAPCCERRQERDDREGGGASDNHTPAPRSRVLQLAVVSALYSSLSGY